MMELAKKVLATAGYGTTILIRPKPDLDLNALAVDGVVPVVYQCVVMKNEITYGAELWMWDHGKKGVSKVLKKVPPPGPEAVREAVKRQQQDAMHLALCNKYCLAM